MTQEPRCFKDKEGTVLISENAADTSIFTEAELNVLDEVCARFEDYSSAEISDISHNEKAWLECNAEHKRIPFRYAFDLEAI